MLMFDIGAHTGTCTVVGLEKGYKVIALEPAPRVFSRLVQSYLYNPNVVPLKFAVSNTNNETIKFYEAEEDGLSTTNIDWLTSEGMPYNGKAYRTIHATTITIDSLVELYGVPDLMKIDVEGAEFAVFRGMTKYYGPLCFEWTEATLDEHVLQLSYLSALGYTEYAIQFITHYLKEPLESEYMDIDSAYLLPKDIENLSMDWVAGGWKEAGMRPTADVGMLWVR